MSFKILVLSLLLLSSSRAMTEELKVMELNPYHLKIIEGTNEYRSKINTRIIYKGEEILFSGKFARAYLNSVILSAKDEKRKIRFLVSKSGKAETRKDLMDSISVSQEKLELKEDPKFLQCQTELKLCKQDSRVVNQSLRDFKSMFKEVLGKTPAKTPAKTGTK